MLGAPPKDNARLEANIISGTPLTPGDVREIERLVREEMARTVEDVLARRTRVLFLDARCATTTARPVAEVLARVLGRDDAWLHEQVDQFTTLAASYLPRI